MKLTTNQREGEWVLTLTGELDHHGAQEIMEPIFRFIDVGGPQCLTLDLSGLTFMDSSGLAVVLRTQRYLQKTGGMLTVCGIPPQARKVFVAAGIDRLVCLR